jgi:small subunit ribosomal protein S6
LGLNSYEALFIIKPDLKEEGIDEAVKSIGEEITKREGQIKETQNLGRRPLAYNIDKYKEGIYILVNFDAPAGIIKPLKDAYKLNNSLLRNLVLKKG